MKASQTNCSITEMQDHDLLPFVDNSRNNPRHSQGEALTTTENSLHVLGDLLPKIYNCFEPYEVVKQQC